MSDKKSDKKTEVEYFLGDGKNHLVNVPPLPFFISLLEKEQQKNFMTHPNKYGLLVWNMLDFDHVFPPHYLSLYHKQ